MKRIIILFSILILTLVVLLYFNLPMILKPTQEIIAPDKEILPEPSPKPSSAPAVSAKNETSRKWTTINLSNDTIQSNNPQMAVYGNSVYVVWQACSDNCEIFFRASNDGGKSFGGAINLSNSTGHSTEPQITASGNNVYVIWRDNTPGDYQVFFRASKNSGATFEPIIVLSSNGTADYPQIVASGSGAYVSWHSPPADTHMLFRASADNGTRFRAPIDLSKEFRAKPQIAAFGSNVYFVWSSEYDILFRVSRDYGASFGNTVQLTNNAFSGWRAINPKIVVHEGNIYLTWTLRSADKNRVFFVASNDEGRTFSNPIELQGHVDIVSAGNNVYLTWTDTVNNKSVIFLKRSFDLGKTFINETNKITLNERIVSPRITASGSYLYVIWTQRVPDPGDGQMFFIGPSQLFFIESADYGARFGEFETLSDDTQVIGARNILASENRVYIVWEEGAPRYGKSAVNTEIILRVK